MRDSGSAATSAAVIVRSLAAIARYSFSSRFSAAMARASKAARRQRAKKSSTLARTALTASPAAAVCRRAAGSRCRTPLLHQSEKPAPR